MSIALYRKYRPARFGDVIGQGAVTEALRNQVMHGRIGHSYLFTGIRGTGKTTFARILAKAVNCPHVQDGEPCGVCDVCRGIEDGSILDVTEIDAASNNGVDNIRDLREETAYAPTVCKMRVYIIDEVHMLSDGAFNALLKIMEEPPAHVLFIFATTELHKVPATILSRCQRYELRRIPVEDIEAQLLTIAGQEGIDLTPPAAALLARLADGAMRDALSLLDTCASLGGTVDEDTVVRLAGVADKSYLFSLCGFIARGDVAGVLRQVGEMYEHALDPSRLCTELTRHVRDLLLAKLTGVSLLRDLTPETAARVQEQSGRFEVSRLLAMLDELSDTADRLGSAPDSILVVQLCLIKLCGQSGSTPASSAGTEPTAAPAAPIPVTVPEKAQQTPVSTVAQGAQRDAEDNIPTRDVSDADAPPWDEPPAAGQTALPLTDPVPVSHPETGQAAVSKPEAAAASDAPDKPQVTEPATSGVAAFPNWDSVAERVMGQNPMMGGFLRKTRAYISNGAVLIESDELFRNLMNKSPENKAVLRDAIEAVTGRRYKLGAYTPQNVAAASGSEAQRQLDELDSLAAMLRDDDI